MITYILSYLSLLISINITYIIKSNKYLIIIFYIYYSVGFLLILFFYMRKLSARILRLNIKDKK
jgi:hypothetical protein